MSRTAEKIFGIAAGGLVAGLFEFLLVEGTLIAGGAYDLANEGYLADFLATGNASELLDFHEMNPGEVFGSLAVVASLVLLFFGLTRGGRARMRGVVT